MKLHVHSAELHPMHGEPLYLGDEDLEDFDRCPTCHSHDLSLVGLTSGKRGRGLELSECSNCSHIFLSRRPRADWYQSYYAETWDTGRMGYAQSVSRTRRFLKSIRPLRSAVRTLRQVLSDGVSDLRRQQFLSMFMGLEPHVSNLFEFPKGAKVLEIGSGYGGALVQMEEAGLIPVGTEASQYRVRIGRNEGANVFFTEISNLDPVREFGPFDYVYSSHVVEHLLDLDSVLSEVMNLLKPDGAIYFEVPNGPAIEKLTDRLHVPVHIHLFSSESLSALLRRHGFRIVRVHEDVNLHVVSVRETTAEGLPDPAFRSFKDRLIPWKDSLDSDHGVVYADNDGGHMRLVRKSNGETIFENKMPYAMPHVYQQGNSERLCNVYVLENISGPDEGAWPIEFHYDTDLAPLWVKRQ